MRPHTQHSTAHKHPSTPSHPLLVSPWSSQSRTRPNTQEKVFRSVSQAGTDLALILADTKELACSCGLLTVIQSLDNILHGCFNLVPVRAETNFDGPSVAVKRASPSPIDPLFMKRFSPQCVVVDSTVKARNRGLGSTTTPPRDPIASSSLHTPHLWSPAHNDGSGGHPSEVRLHLFTLSNISNRTPITAWTRMQP